MSARRNIWGTAWRVAVGFLLLLWIFHSIFVNEAREQAQRGNLIEEGHKVQWTKAQPPPRTEQWRLGWKYGPPALWTTLRSVQPAMFGLSLLLMGATLLLGILRWRMILRVQQFDLSLLRTAEISLVSHFFNSFLLGTVGGDVMKAYYAARETRHKKTEAVVTVFVDRLVGLWSMLVFAALMILPNLQLFERTGLRHAVQGLATQPAESLAELMRITVDEPFVMAAALLLAMTAVGSAFVFLAFRGGVSKTWTGAREWLRRLPKGEWIERSLNSCRHFGQQPGLVFRAVGLSMALNVACVLQFWVLSRGLQMDISLLSLCLVVPTVICVAALPIVPGGLGLRENLFVQLLAAPAIGAYPTNALSLSLLAFAGSLVWSIFGGCVYVLFKHRHHLAEGDLVAEP